MTVAGGDGAAVVAGDPAVGLVGFDEGGIVVGAAVVVLGGGGVGVEVLGASVTLGGAADGVVTVVKDIVVLPLSSSKPLMIACNAGFTVAGGAGGAAVVGF